MAKKPKPGKKFKYQLESVLKVRAIKEKKEQEKFADKKREYITEKENKNLIDLWKEINSSKTLLKATHPAKNRWKWQLYVVIGGALLSEIILLFT